jgi:6-phosphofructokinase 1
LNAAIRAIVRVADQAGDQVIGFHHGWRGVVEGDAQPLLPQDTNGILQCGGTILRTARFHPDEHEGGIAAVCNTFEQHRLDTLIVIGGNGTLGSAHEVAQHVPLIGIPKTIDNDVIGTQRCIGFDTAVATAAEAIDRVHTTAESHDRLMVVEVMGRTTGWLALSAGLSAGADAICLPERSTDMNVLANAIEARHDAGSNASVVVVAEGAALLGAGQDESRSIGSIVAAELASRTDFETRLTVLGHVQRGGPPLPSDRLLATRLGVSAVAAAHAHRSDVMTSIVDDEVQLVSLSAAAQGARGVPLELLDVASHLTLC